MKETQLEESIANGALHLESSKLFHKPTKLAKHFDTLPRIIHYLICEHNI